jgi:hypothetical protein
MLSARVDTIMVAWFVSPDISFEWWIDFRLIHNRSWVLRMSAAGGNAHWLLMKLV